MLASSSSRHPFLDFRDGSFHASTSFATSDVRSEPQSEHSQLSATHLSTIASSFALMPQSLYPLQGIIRQGQHAVLTRAYPDVIACLEFAETRLKLPPTLPEDVFTLAAEHAYHNPSSAAHWLFWGNGRQIKESLAVMRHVCTHQPPLVLCSSDWSNGIDVQRNLTRRRTLSMRRQLQNKAWFSCLALPNLPFPEEQPVPDQGRVLRKRKPPASPAPTESVEEEAPPKRAKTTHKRCAPPSSSATPQPEHILSQSEGTPSQSEHIHFPSKRDASPSDRTLQPEPVPHKQPSIEARATPKLTRSVSQSSSRTLVESDRSRSPSTDTVWGPEAEKGLKDVEADDEDSQIMTRARRRAADLEASKATTKRRASRRKSRKT